MNMIVSSLIGVACLGFFLLAFGGVGAFLLYKSWQQNKQASVSQNWPSSPGQVIDSHVDEGWSEDSDGDRHRTYHPQVKYSYSVNGQPFTGEMISFGFKRADRSPNPAQAVVNAYPTGKSVVVYFNPTNPAEAVLERRASSLGITFVMGLVFLAVAVCLACPMLGSLLFRLLPVVSPSNL